MRALALLFGLCLVLSCRSAIEEAAGDGVVARVGEEIAAQLPEDRREGFLELWGKDRGGALKEAASVLGIDKLADLIEDQDARNKELAEDLRRRGVDALRDRWLAIFGWAGTALAGLLGFSKRNKWLKLFRLVVDGVEDLRGGHEEAREVVKARVGKAADKAGVRDLFDAEVSRAKA